MVLEKVCEYMYYYEKHKDARDVQDMDIPPELCLELLVAADYLDRMSLSCCGTVWKWSLTN
jgi:transcription elongation factor B subunit 1